MVKSIEKNLANSGNIEALSMRSNQEGNSRVGVVAAEVFATLSLGSAGTILVVGTLGGILPVLALSCAAAAAGSVLGHVMASYLYSINDANGISLNYSVVTEEIDSEEQSVAGDLAKAVAEDSGQLEKQEKSEHPFFKLLFTENHLQNVAKAVCYTATGGWELATGEKKKDLDRIKSENKTLHPLVALTYLLTHAESREHMKTTLQRTGMIGSKVVDQVLEGIKGDWNKILRDQAQRGQLERFVDDVALITGIDVCALRSKMDACLKIDGQIRKEISDAAELKSLALALFDLVDQRKPAQHPEFFTAEGKKAFLQSLVASEPFSETEGEKAVIASLEQDVEEAIAPPSLTEAQSKVVRDLLLCVSKSQVRETAAIGLKNRALLSKLAPDCVVSFMQTDREAQVYAKEILEKHPKNFSRFCKVLPKEMSSRVKQAFVVA